MPDNRLYEFVLLYAVNESLGVKEERIGSNKKINKEATGLTGENVEGCALCVAVHCVGGVGSERQTV